MAEQNIEDYRRAFFGEGPAHKHSREHSHSHVQESSQIFVKHSHMDKCKRSVVDSIAYTVTSNRSRSPPRSVLGLGMPLTGDDKCE